MTANLKEINQQLPAYSQLNTYKLYNEESEKTPKRVLNDFCISKSKINFQFFVPS